jgi:pentachlorophenol monooxygenase
LPAAIRGEAPVQLLDSYFAERHPEVARADSAPDASLQALARRWRGRINCISGDAENQLGPSAMLVRPDGFVAWKRDSAADHEGAARAPRRIGSVNLKAPRASASFSGNMNVGRPLELTVAAFKEVGYEHDVRFEPWTRALHGAMNG